jgi:hypothetical protein
MTPREDGFAKAVAAVDLQIAQARLRSSSPSSITTHRPKTPS